MSMWKKILALLCASVVCLSGCGDITSGNRDGSPDTEVRAAKVDDELVQNLMKNAHFLSAPSSVPGEDSDEQHKEKVRNYKVDYSMQLENSAACFVLGDSKGEYGQLMLLEFQVDSEGVSFAIKAMRGGEEDVERFQDPVFIEPSETGAYDVELTVSEEKMTAVINGEEIGGFVAPSFDLGTVGVYQRRGCTEVLLVDLLILDHSSGEVLLQDDFDGAFVNNLYSYNYGSAAESIFSPYYYRTKEAGGDKSLVVKPGFLLTEAIQEPAPVFRKSFETDIKKLESAYICMTALGSFDLELNGRKVNSDFLSPGRLMFDQSLNYVSYDITDFLEKENTVDIFLFHGFFDRGVGYPEIANSWGNINAIKGGVVLTYKDGTSSYIPTDESFKVSRDTRYRFDDIYQGEIIDDRFAGNADSFAEPVIDAVSEHFLKAPITAKENEPIAEIEALSPISVTEPVPGRFVYDFGQNHAGTIRLKKKALDSQNLNDGQVLTFRYAEALNAPELVNSDDENGTVWTSNLYTARATDYYIYSKEGRKGDEDITFAHTYHGFRYLEITGINEAIAEEDIEAVVMSSGMAETGSFSCSNELINRYYNNSRYSMRSNMMDVPTDCPQRDERLGWSGDAQITSHFATYQYDADRFYRNYLRLLVSEQDESGAYPDIAPVSESFGGHSCWGDAPVMIAWNLFLQYGDTDVVKENLDSLCRWIDYLEENSDDYLMTSGGYGDHLAKQTTPESLTDTAMCAHSAELVSRMAHALGDEDKAARYQDISDKFKSRWRQEFVRDDWSVAGGIIIPDAETQTAYSLGIEFGLFDEEMMEEAAERLSLLTEYSGYMFGPGYSGMGYYLPALADYGYGDKALAVLTNEQPGGFSELLNKGFTTNPESFNSFSYEEGGYRLDGPLNHAAYSAPAAFLYTHILGIQPDENAPGYEHFYVKPVMMEGLESASGSIETRYGQISVSYDKAAGKINCTVPEGTTCSMTLPNGEIKELEPGNYEFNW